MKNEVTKQRFEQAVQSEQALAALQYLKELIVEGFKGEEIHPFLEKTENIPVVNNILNQLYKMNYPDLRKKMGSEDVKYKVPASAQNLVLTAIQLKIVNKEIIKYILNEMIENLRSQYKFDVALAFKNLEFPNGTDNYIKLIYIKFVEKILLEEAKPGEIKDFLYPKSRNMLEITVYQKAIEEVFSLAIEAGDDDILLDYLLDYNFGYNKDRVILNSMKEILREKLLKKIAYNISLDKGDELIENLKRIERLSIDIKILLDKPFDSDTFLKPEKVLRVVSNIITLQTAFSNVLKKPTETSSSRPRSMTNASTRSSFSYMSFSSSLEKSIDRTLYKELIKQMVNQPEEAFSSLVERVMGDAELYDDASKQFMQTAKSLPSFEELTPRKPKFN